MMGELSTRLLLLVCVVIWGWTFVATKICLAHMNPIELVGLRFMIGVPVLLAIILRKKLPLVFGRADLWKLCCGSGIFALHFLIQAIALNYTTATNTSWIISVTPLVMAALSYLVLKERIGSKEIVGILVATAGILLLISRGDLGSLDWMKSTGDWLILLSAHTWALYTVATRDLSRTRPPLVVTLAVLIPVTVICFIYMLLTSHPARFLSLSPAPVTALLFLGTLGTAAQWFWQEGVARIGAARAGVYLYLEPVATTVLAVPLLAEKLRLSTVAGGLMVLLGVWWAQRKSNAS